MKAPVAALIDAVAVAAFAAVGRASHDESIGPLGVATTAWPFWCGAAAGWVITRAWRRPNSVGSGVGVWLGAVVGGMVLRAVTGAGVQPAFVVVAGITLAIGLLGWRAVSLLAQRRVAGRAAT